MITAEDFLNNYRFKAGEHIGNSDLDTIAQYARDFAKLHVKAAIEEASKKVDESVVPSCSDHTPYWGECQTCGRYENPDIILDEESLKELILNAYPLENIK